MVALRKAALLSQTQLAQSLGVGHSYVSKVERGDMYEDLVFFIDWCRVCIGARIGHTLTEPTSLLTSTSL